MKDKVCTYGIRKTIRAVKWSGKNLDEVKKLFGDTVRVTQRGNELYVGNLSSGARVGDILVEGGGCYTPSEFSNKYIAVGVSESKLELPLVPLENQGALLAECCAASGCDIGKLYTSDGALIFVGADVVSATDAGWFTTGGTVTIPQHKITVIEPSGSPEKLKLRVIRSSRT